MWSAIKYITSAYSLAAFITACVMARIYFKRRHETLLINLAEPRDRAKLIESSLEKFRVDTSKLDSQQKFELLDKQLRERRYRLYAVLLTLVAALGIASLTTMYSPKTQGQASRPEPSTNGAGTSDPQNATNNDATAQKPPAQSSIAPASRTTTGPIGTPNHNEHAVEVKKIKTGHRSKIGIGNTTSEIPSDVGVGQIETGDDSTIDIGNSDRR